MEWERHLEGIFSAAVITGTFPRSQIEISLDVLNADGGRLVQREFALYIW